MLMTCISKGDRFYIAERNCVLEASITEINRVYVKDGNAYIEATCKVLLPGMRNVVRVYTFCRHTLNTSLFVGDNAYNNAVKMLESNLNNAKKKIQEEARADAEANFSEGIVTTCDFHRSVLQEFYNSDEEIEIYINAYYEKYDQLCKFV